jgi:hypothetical protein
VPCCIIHTPDNNVTTARVRHTYGTLNQLTQLQNKIPYSTDTGEDLQRRRKNERQPKMASARAHSRLGVQTTQRVSISDAVNHQCYMASVMDEGMSMEHWWSDRQRKLKYWGGGVNLVPAPLCPPQISRRLARFWTRTSSVTARWMTGWAMARPCVQTDPDHQRGHILNTRNCINWMIMLRAYN